MGVEIACSKTAVAQSKGSVHLASYGIDYSLLLHVPFKLPFIVFGSTDPSFPSGPPLPRPEPDLYVRLSCVRIRSAFFVLGTSVLPSYAPCHPPMANQFHRRSMELHLAMGLLTQQLVMLRLPLCSTRKLVVILFHEPCRKKGRDAHSKHKAETEDAEILIASWYLHALLRALGSRLRSVRRYVIKTCWVVNSLRFSCVQLGIILELCQRDLIPSLEFSHPWTIRDCLGCR